MELCAGGTFNSKHIFLYSLKINTNARNKCLVAAAHDDFIAG